MNPGIFYNRASLQEGNTLDSQYHSVVVAGRLKLEKKKKKWIKKIIIIKQSLLKLLTRSEKGWEIPLPVSASGLRTEGFRDPSDRQAKFFEHDLLWFIKIKDSVECWVYKKLCQVLNAHLVDWRAIVSCTCPSCCQLSRCSDLEPNCWILESSGRFPVSNC